MIGARAFRFVCLLIVVQLVGLVKLAAAETEDRIKEIQGFLIWTGHYDGLITGRMSESTHDAIRAFQADIGEAGTGDLSESQFSQLQEHGQERIRSVGFKTVLDSATGIEIGLPQHLLDQKKQTNRGTNWIANDDSLDIDTLSFVDGRSLRALYGTLTKVGPGRRIEYESYHDDWFVIEGQDNDGRRFYVRSSARGGEIRGFSVTYPKAMKRQIFPIVIAMSNSFNPFPVTAPSAVARRDEPRPQEPIPAKPPASVADASDACSMFPGLC